MIRESWFGGRTTRAFTLQWHLTHACPYRCQHCYDRCDPLDPGEPPSRRIEPDLPEALALLESFLCFCARHKVSPHVSLSGGDPLCYRHFWELYAAIAATDARISILGNPIAPQKIDRLMAIRAPDYYQVSLEGLPHHDNAMRGPGHFSTTMRFLEAARARRMNTHVMLTLTRANLTQTLALGQTLRGLTARFTFNRLAQVGGGTALELPQRREFLHFLLNYREASRNNTLLRQKDNLFALFRRDLPPRFGRPHTQRGCTGHGCGAAFDFVALLPDGEVHACRKFPSPLGNLYRDDLETIYQSPAARRYRAGPSACRNCRLQSECRGCMAVVHGMGLDALTECDPFCPFSENK